MLLVAIVWQAFIAMLIASADAQSIAANQGVRVARFKGDCEAAVSFTLDDGWEDDATVAAPIFDRYRIPATFFLVSGVIPTNASETTTHKYGQISWSRWKQIALVGHEIGNHTLNHRGLTKSDDETVRKEIEDGRDRIAQQIGIVPISFAYPGNGRDDRVRKFVYAHHAVAREFETGYGGTNFTTAKADALVDSALQQKRWMVVMIHAITNGYAAMSSPDILENHLKHVQTLTNRMWVDTFGNVGRYVKERDAASLTVQRDASSATISIRTGLGTALFNYPLTVVIENVRTATAEAKRDGVSAPLPVTVADDRLMIEIVPEVAPVIVRWRSKEKE